MAQSATNIAFEVTDDALEGLAIRGTAVMIKIACEQSQRLRSLGIVPRALKALLKG